MLMNASRAVSVLVLLHSGRMGSVLRRDSVQVVYNLIPILPGEDFNVAAMDHRWEGYIYTIVIGYFEQV